MISKSTLTHVCVRTYKPTNTHLDVSDISRVTKIWVTKLNATPDKQINMSIYDAIVIMKMPNRYLYNKNLKLHMWGWHVGLILNFNCLFNSQPTTGYTIQIRSPSGQRSNVSWKHQLQPPSFTYTLWTQTNTNMHKYKTCNCKRSLSKWIQVWNSFLYQRYLSLDKMLEKVIDQCVFP